MDFARATAVEKTGPGAYAAAMDEDWWVMRGPNGGYVAAVVLRAILAELGDPARAARSLTLHYLAPPVAGPVQIDVAVERSGRSLSTVSARMSQDGKTLVLALAALSAAWAGTHDFSDAALPAITPLDEAPPRPDTGLPPIAQRFDFRLGLGGAPFQGGERALTGGWIRLSEPAVVDVCAVAALTDAWFPAVFTRMSRPAALPTIDLTIHFREPLPLPGAQAGDWSIGIFRSTHAREGFVEEDGEIWTPDGVLLAQSRQLALLI